MPSREMDFVVKEIPRATMNVTVHYAHSVRFRIWLALKLIAVACWILQWDLEIEDFDE